MVACSRRGVSAPVYRSHLVEQMQLAVLWSREEIDSGPAVHAFLVAIRDGPFPTISYAVSDATLERALSSVCGCLPSKTTRLRVCLLALDSVLGGDELLSYLAYLFEKRCYLSAIEKYLSV